MAGRSFTVVFVVVVVASGVIGVGLDWTERARQVAGGFCLC
jgi:hypothetical protein